MAVRRPLASELLLLGLLPLALERLLLGLLLLALERLLLERLLPVDSTWEGTGANKRGGGSRGSSGGLRARGRGNEGQHSEK